MPSSTKASDSSIAYFATSMVALVEGVRLFILDRLSDGLLVQYIPDDGFYYLQAARNFARMGRWTFDGTEPSSGFHLLWGYLLALCFRLSPGIGVHRLFVLSGVVQSFCLALAAFLVTRTAQRFAGARSAGGVLLVFLSAISLIQGTWLMETSFVIVGAAATFHLLLRTDLKPTSLLLPAAWLLGVGVSLSRSDAGVPSLVLLIAHLFLWRRGASTRLMASTAASVFAGVVTGLALIAFNTHWVSGQWVQASAQEKVFWTSLVGRSFGAPVRIVTDFFNPLYNFAAPLSSTEKFFDRHLHSARHHVYIEPFLFACFWIVILSGGVAIRLRAAPTLVTKGLLLVPVVILLTYMAADRYVSAAMQPWYVGNLEVPVALLAGVGFAWVLHRSFPAGAALLTLMCGAGIVGSFVPTSPWGEAMWRTGVMLRQHPEIRPIGAWNAGIIAYFAGTDVVNLDGLMNDTVVPFTRQGHLEAYIARRGLAYIVDSPQMWNENSSRLGGYSNGKLAQCIVSNTDLFPRDPYNNFGGDTIRLYTLSPACLARSAY